MISKKGKEQQYTEKFKRKGQDKMKGREGKLEAKGLYGRVMSIKECLLFPVSLGIVLERSQRKPRSNRNQLSRIKLTHLK